MHANGAPITLSLPQIPSGTFTSPRGNAFTRSHLSMAQRGYDATPDALKDNKLSLAAGILKEVSRHLRAGYRHEAARELSLFAAILNERAALHARDVGDLEGEAILLGSSARDWTAAGKPEMSTLRRLQAVERFKQLSVTHTERKEPYLSAAMLEHAVDLLDASGLRNQRRALAAQLADKYKALAEDAKAEHAPASRSYFLGRAAHYQRIAGNDEEALALSATFLAAMYIVHRP